MYIKDREASSPSSWGHVTTYTPSWQNVFNGMPENEQTRLIKSYCEKIGKDICWQITLLHNELLAMEKRLKSARGDVEMAEGVTGTPSRTPRRWRSESPQRRDEVRSSKSVEAIAAGASQFAPEMQHMRSQTSKAKVPGNARQAKQSQGSRVTWSCEATVPYESSQSRPESTRSQAKFALLDDSSEGDSPGSPQRPRTAEDSPTAPVGSPPPLPPIPNKLPDEETWAQPAAPTLANSPAKENEASPQQQQQQRHRKSSVASIMTNSGETRERRGSLPDASLQASAGCDNQMSYRSVSIPSPRLSAFEGDNRGTQRKSSKKRSVFSWRSKTKENDALDAKELMDDQELPISPGSEARKSVGFSLSTHVQDYSPEDTEGDGRQDSKESPQLFEVDGNTGEQSERLPLAPVRPRTPGTLAPNRGFVTEERKTVIGRGASNTVKAMLGMLNDDPSRGGLQGYARGIVTSDWFEYTIAILLISNAVFIGSRAEYRAQNYTERTPHIFTTAELVFGMTFTAELLLRIFVFRLDFLRTKGWEWNLFDLIVVSLQFVESIFDLLGAAFSNEKGMKQLSILRMLRLGRIVRLLRMVRLVPALKSMVYLIAASMQSFFWTTCLLALLMFGVAVHFTEVIADFREDHYEDPGYDVTSSELEGAWGSVLKSVTSLYQAILGGIDWKDLTDRIDEVSWSASVVFAMYIAFASLVMLNLVTGVFVDGAQRIVADDRDAELVKTAKKMFDIVDDQHDHQITWHEFAVHLEDPGMAEYFRLVGISRKEAKDLFQLLDHDHSGTLSIKEFVHGCLGLRGPAKSIDLARLAYNHELQGRRLGHIETMIQTEIVSVQRVEEEVARALLSVPVGRSDWNEREPQPMQRSAPSFYLSEP